MKRRRVKPVSDKRLAERPAYLAAREVAMERAGERCEVVRFDVRCGHRAVHAHHVLPRSSGGKDVPENLLACCEGCHQWVHAHPAESEPLGYLKRAGRPRSRIDTVPTFDNTAYSNPVDAQAMRDAGRI